MKEVLVAFAYCLLASSFTASSGTMGRRLFNDDLENVIVTTAKVQHSRDWRSFHLYTPLRVKEKNMSKVWDATRKITCWSLGKKRNNFIFNSKTVSVEDLFAEIKTLSFSWINVRCKKLTLDWNSWKTVYGDVYVCVDIYKQPALNHPALKDPDVKVTIHEFIEKTLAVNEQKKVELEAYIKFLGFWEDKGCPIGTVPFVDQIATDQIATTHLKSEASSSFFNQSISPNPFTIPPRPRVSPIEFAGVVFDDNKSFYGIYNVEAEIIIYNPQVADVPSQQYSAASIILESGIDNQIQVGWMVSPYLFGDHRTHFYLAMRVSNDTNDTCYHTQCQGFIQLSHYMPLGFVFSDVSIVGSNRFSWPFRVTKKFEYGWEVYLGDKPTLIGLFPDYLFRRMLRAERVRLGGQIYAPFSDKTTPPMGSGQFTSGNHARTSYMYNIVVGRVFPNDSRVFQSGCYSSTPINVSSDQIYDSSFLFGGPSCY